MSSSRPPPTQSASTNSVRSRQTARIIAQTTADAKIQADFDESGNSFDYSTSVRDIETLDPSNNVTTAYLSQIQKSLTIQPFGCLVALDDKNLKVIAYSDNAPDLLTTVSHTVPAGLGDQSVLTLGTDLRTIFTAPSSSALYKVFGFPDVSLLNPVLVHCKTSGEPFYAIVHRVTGSIVIDFEPVKPFEVPMTASGALQSYKLAAKAIARLQSVPSGNMDRLCDTMVEQVFEMTGYDRTMAYKFHDDDHGEVVSEVTKPGLEPYLGLHYPATDIPQAARFLFMKNKVRIIVDCRAKPVKVNQDENLPFNLTLCGSTLRAPHTCHLQYMENMTSIGSLVMAIVVNDDEEESPAEVTGKSKRLWGLVVCHNTTPRFVPFPLRYACEFLAQVFAIHVSKELELERQILEKNILRTQTLLCDMLMRDPPLGIVSLESPNVADLVKCDGAVLLYENETYKLGTTPTDSQLRDIVSWMYEYHADSTGLSTDSLNDAGFPGASALGDVFCGMAAVRITSKDMVFWFRSHTASEIQWGGARHDEGVKDDGRKMHPRSSFKAFLEVVRGRSLPWKEFEMDAIHSLQIIVRNALIKEESSGTRRRNPNDDHELETVTNEVVRLIETATVPILSVDADGLINGWNSKIADLTGLSVEEAIGIHLITLVEDTWVDIVREMLHMALQGNEKQNIEFAIRRRRRGEPIRLVVNACASRDLEDNVVGVCFVAQDITGEKMALDKFTRIEGDYKAIVQNPSPLIPPIFGADEFGSCSEWNLAMTKLTGWTRDEVIGKMVLGEVFGVHKTTYCHLKNQETFVNLGVVLNSMMNRPEKVSFGFFSKERKFVECLLCVSKTVSGVFCFLQLPSLQLHQQSVHEQNALKMLAYTKRHARNSLNGIIFARTELGEPEMVTITSEQCENQLSRVLDDSDLDTIIDGNMDLEMVEFTLQEVLVACISQVMVESRSKGVQIVNDVAQDVVTQTLYGDSVRLQQVLSDFLLVSLDFMATGSRLNISACLTLGEAVHLAHIELRMMCHGGGGVPESVLNQMFESYGGGEVADGAGISLLISRKLIRLMNGDVRYLREDYNKSTFIVSLQLAIPT